MNVLSKYNIVNYYCPYERTNLFLTKHSLASAITHKQTYSLDVVVGFPLDSSLLMCVFAAQACHFNCPDSDPCGCFMLACDLTTLLVYVASLLSILRCESSIYPQLDLPPFATHSLFITLDMEVLTHSLLNLTVVSLFFAVPLEALCDGLNI